MTTDRRSATLGCRLVIIFSKEECMSRFLQATAFCSLIAACAFSTPSFAAEPSGGGRSGAGERQAFQQQRSDKTQQGQELVNQQSMSPQTNTGADLTGGRDSHLGPHDEAPKASKQGKTGKTGGGQ